jgi:hypothetical protein
MRHHVLDAFADDRFAGNPAAVAVEPNRRRLTFGSDNGMLHAERSGDLIVLDLPSVVPVAADPPPGLLEARCTSAVSCGITSVAAGTGR